MRAGDLIGESELRAEGRERVCACVNMGLGGGLKLPARQIIALHCRLTSVPLNATHVGNLVLLAPSPPPPSPLPMSMAERLLQRYQEPVVPPPRCGTREPSVDCQRRTPRSSLI